MNNIAGALYRVIKIKNETKWNEMKWVCLCTFNSCQPFMSIKTAQQQTIIQQ